MLQKYNLRARLKRRNEIVILLRIVPKYNGLLACL
jgi:hypothetical protein